MSGGPIVHFHLLLIRCTIERAEKCNLGSAVIHPKEVYAAFDFEQEVRLAVELHEAPKRDVSLMNQLVNRPRTELSIPGRARRS